jgi:2-polyprenyl-3-methyl-5-hydroxy-6-metoxy-1,4-benzoquinol methylase
MTISQGCRACPICGERKIEPLHRQRFVLEEGHPLKDGYDVAHCCLCGFVYADVAATQADYDAFYAQMSKYEDAATSTGSGESLQDQERLRKTAELVSAELPSREARILDIGCAGGGLLYAFRQLGYEDLVGVDPSPACARQTRERTGEAYHGWITSLPHEIGTFDCIILSHVLEHVLDVSAAIQALAPLLRPDGRVFLEVPNAVRYADHVYAPFQDFNTEHINHFSARSLDNAMQLRGFAVTSGGERLLHSSPITFTPAVYRFYRSTGNAHPIQPEQLLKPAILRYIERSSALLKSIDDCIREAFQQSDELVVWGTGQLTLKLLAETSLSTGRVAAFVDSNPIHHGRRLAGAPIVAPAALGGYTQPILIGTTLHHREIVKQIEGLGLKNRIVLLPEGGPKYFGEGL